MLRYSPSGFQRSFPPADTISLCHSSLPIMSRISMYERLSKLAYENWFEEKKLTSAQCSPLVPLRTHYLPQVYRLYSLYPSSAPDGTHKDPWNFSRCALMPTCRRTRLSQAGVSPGSQIGLSNTYSTRDEVFVHGISPFRHGPNKSDRCRGKDSPAFLNHCCHIRQLYQLFKSNIIIRLECSTYLSNKAIQNVAIVR
jgi:hypothetical protein